MRKINILTKDIYNRIAAGEVIDRPYSAVKELIENSLDAGATEIEIYIEQGGKQLVRVIDNGCGIERDDMRTAFLAHATSKISCADDLGKITTLGFRGEALASISVISRVELTSVTAGNRAYKVTCDDGNVGAVVPAALEKGTDVCVRNLFYNTPVRAKFLKSDKKEEADITNFVTRYILGNTDVSFRYYVDGKLTLQSNGGGLDEALAQVYGSKVISQCLKIDAEKDGIKISGFISNQHFFKPNKTYQSLFLNGRYIINNTINTAITKAYASYAMKRQYPFYVLNIEVPIDIVDVNVHPSKADVRFQDNGFIFGVVYKLISSILDGTASAAQFVMNVARIPEIKSTIPEENKPQIESVHFEPAKEINRSVVSFSINNEKEAAIFEAEKPKEKEVKYYDPLLDYFSCEEPKPAKLVVSNDTIPNFNIFTDRRIEEAYNRRMQEQQMIEYEECKFKGNLFNTYLIYEKCDTVYIIDQHAAHERLIYDRLMEELAHRQVNYQNLLVPYLFTANAQETEFIEKHLSTIRGMGFDIKVFGMNSFRIDAVPADLQEINLEKFFEELLSDIKGLKEIKLEEILKEKIAMSACKHAVKGGMKLTEDEVNKLFEMLDGNMGLKCPHGRPICITLSKKDIEKMFKRIV